MNPPSPHHSVRRIVLPSGRAIEVVRFQDEPTTEPRGLHLCPDCASELVQPTEWVEAAGEGWELRLECPNCWRQEEGVYSREEVAQLEDHLDGGLTSMLDDLRRLTQANVADQIERFAAALAADLILPEDF